MHGVCVALHRAPVREARDARLVAAYAAVVAPLRMRPETRRPCALPLAERIVAAAAPRSCPASTCAILPRWRRIRASSHSRGRRSPSRHTASEPRPERPSKGTDREDRSVRQIGERFIEACTDGDLDGLLALLDPAVDGAGDTAAEVVVGAANVAPGILRYLGPPASPTLLHLPSATASASLQCAAQGPGARRARSTTVSSRTSTLWR